MVLVVVVLGCRAVHDFYPLNSFPMYADPGPEPSEYVVLRDGAGVLVDIQMLTGETSAKVKKKYIDRRNELATAAGIEKADEATPALRAQAWRDIAGRLQRLAQRRKRVLPDQIQMQVGLIYQDDAGFREEVQDIGVATLVKETRP